MKKTFNIGKYLILLIIIGLVLIVWKADNEKNEPKKNDRDDINVIDKIGKQSFDKAKNINYIPLLPKAVIKPKVIPKPKVKKVRVINTISRAS